MSDEFRRTYLFLILQKHLTTCLFRNEYDNVDLAGSSNESENTMHDLRYYLLLSYYYFTRYTQNVVYIK